MIISAQPIADVELTRADAPAHRAHALSPSVISAVHTQQTQDATATVREKGDRENVSLSTVDATNSLARGLSGLGGNENKANAQIELATPSVRKRVALRRAGPLAFRSPSRHTTSHIATSGKTRRMT